MRTFIYISILLLLPLTFVAQHSLPHTNKAAMLYHDGDLIGAKGAIEQAVQSPQENEHAYTWYVRGFIYKEIYKQVEKESRFSENREISLESIQRSVQLDRTGRYLENNRKGIEFLAVTYYNDVVTLTESITEDDYDRPAEYFKKYKDALRILDPFADFSASDLEFNRMMAGALEDLYIFGGHENLTLLERSQAYYAEALRIDPEDYTSNYNTAISYYNRGVFLIKQIDYKTEIFELMMIQDECLKLFRQSLPYMIKANELVPDRKETLYGLMAIYRALNEYEKSEFYLSEIERLIKEGVIKG